MKYARKSIAILTVLMLSGILISTALAAYPISNVTMNVVDGTDSYFLTTLSGIPAGEDISDGTYLGWCVETDVTLPRDDPHTVTLYSSLDPPASLASEAWDMVNYILNHKQGGKIDIQAAIWYFIKLDSGWPTPGYYAYDPYADNRYGGNPPSADTEAMVADALANGDGYTPGPCDVVAVICMPSSCVQVSIVELEIPCEQPPGLTPGFWKNNLAVYLGLANGKRGYSDPTGSPTVTKDTMGDFFDSLAGTYDLNQLYRNLCPQLDGTTAAIRDAAANVFNVAAGLSPGPPWI